MKKYLFLALLLAAICPLAMAQKGQGMPAPPAPTEAPAVKPIEDNAEARTATEKLSAKYTLTADQAKQVYTVEARKYRNLKAISGLKTTNLALYRTKLQNLQTNTLASIRRALNTKEQVMIYKKTQAELRTQRAQKREEMMRQNAPREAIEVALLEIYAE